MPSNILSGRRRLATAVRLSRLMAAFQRGSLHGRSATKMKIPAILILALVLVGCNKMEMETSSCFDHVVPSGEQATMFRSNIVSFLAARGFSGTADPGGLASWSGIKMPGMTTRWYSGTFAGSPAFLVRISEAPIPGARVQFTGDTSWSLKGSASDHDRIRKQISEFSKQLQALVATQNAELSGPANRSQPIRPETNRPIPESGSSH